MCFLSGIVLLGCFESKNTTQDSEFDLPALLDHYANSIILPRYQNFAEATESLKTSVVTLADSPTQDNLAAVQQAHKAAFLAWEGVRTFSFGPANTVSLGSNTEFFPVDTSLIEDNIASGSYDFEVPKYAKSKGLSAIDYLINSAKGKVDSTWSTLDTANQRREYLMELTNLVDSLADAVVEQWSPSGGNYQKTFVENTGNSIGSSLGVLINLYIQGYEFTRTRQIADPAGIFLSPLGVSESENPSPERLEALYGEFSLELVEVALQGHKDLFAGTAVSSSNKLGDSLGLDDYLESRDAKKGEEDLHTAILNQFNDSQEKLQAIKSTQSTLKAALENDRENIRLLWVSLQNQIVNLKVNLTSALGVTITFQSNDGD
jgi:predicted lipoprotein